jgi:hypothetical protein
MPVATALLRPRRLRRAAALEAGGDAALVADLLALGARLAEDVAAEGEIAGCFRDAFGATAEALAERAKDGGDAALARLGAWAESVAGPLAALGEELGGVGSPADAARAAEALLERFTALAGSLDAAWLQPHLQVFFDVLQVDLGLGPRVLEDTVWALLDEVSARVRALPPADDAVAADRRREVVGVLRRVRRRMRDRFVLPFPTAAQAAGLLAEWLRRTGIAARMRAASCAGRGLADAAGAVARVAESVPFGGALSFGSVGAAAADAAPTEQYCWYASWLLDKNVRVNAARTQVLKGDEVIHTGTGVRWNDAPVFHQNEGVWYAFRLVTPETMEKMAYWSFVAVYGLEALLLLTALKPTDYALKASNSVVAAIYATVALTRNEPVPTWVEWVSRLAIALLTSVEGLHTLASGDNKATFWVTLMVPDLGATVIYMKGAQAPRDLLLSGFTLLNSPRQARPDEGQPERRAENRRVIGPVVGLVGTGMGKLLTLAFPRADYGQPFSDAEMAGKTFVLWGFLIQTAFTVTGAVLGELLSWAVSGSPDTRRFGEDMWKVWLMNTGLFLPNLYMDVEGSTSGGTWNPDGDAFAGYPPHESSPYLLPYAKDTTAYVPQGNQGFWSHYWKNGSQVYAYDFSLDQGVSVLAARPGTVVAFFDGTPDDTVAGGSWNFVVIRHDLKDDGSDLEAPLPEHDCGAGGTPVVTFAVYGHGRQNSVTGALGASPVGVKVSRGDVIMRSGDTGTSFHNHLHIHVQQEVLPRPPLPVPAPGDPPPPPLSSAVRDTRFTIPFVFKEVTHVLGTDGVPATFNAYTSENG